MTTTHTPTPLLPVRLSPSKNAEIVKWLNYWTNAKMLNIDAIQSLQQVYEARKYCPFMRVGVFTHVTDGHIWDALRLAKGE